MNLDLIVNGLNYRDAGILTGIIIAIGEGLKKMGFNPKFLPLINVILGIIGGCIFISPDDIKVGIITGLTIGLGASGLYSSTKNVSQGVQNK